LIQGYLRQIRSAESKTPITYVLRAEAVVSPEALIAVYDSLDEDLEATHLMSGSEYMVDNGRVFNLLSDYIAPKSFAYTYIKKHAATRDGRALWLDIIALGDSESSRIAVVQDAHRQLEAKKFDGKTKNETLANHIAKLVECENTIEMYKPTGSSSRSTDQQARSLFNSITHPDFKDIKTAIAIHPTAMVNYNEMENILVTGYNNLLGNLPGQLNRRVSQVATQQAAGAVTAGSGKSGKRGKRGRGKGKGAAGKATGGNADAQGDGIIGPGALGKDGQPVVLEDRHYSPAEYKNLYGNQRAEIARIRGDNPAKKRKVSAVATEVDDAVDGADDTSEDDTSDEVVPMKPPTPVKPSSDPGSQMTSRQIGALSTRETNVTDTDWCGKYSWETVCLNSLRLKLAGENTKTREEIEFYFMAVGLEYDLSKNVQENAERYHQELASRVPFPVYSMSDRFPGKLMHEKRFLDRFVKEGRLLSFVTKKQKAAHRQLVLGITMTCEPFWRRFGVKCSADMFALAPIETMEQVQRAVLSLEALEKDIKRRFVIKSQTFDSDRTDPKYRTWNDMVYSDKFLRELEEEYGDDPNYSLLLDQYGPCYFMEDADDHTQYDE
jgi:hypothetical protein